MSVYNGMPYVCDAVDSVLKQTFQDFEFVIVDDGSTDETSRFLDAVTDSRVKVLRQENKGLGKPLNKWMRTCQGDYIMRLDADDRCHPERAQKQLDFLDAHPEVILAGTQYQVFSDYGAGHASRLPLKHQDIVSGMLRGWHTLSHPTIMFRRSLLDHIDGYIVSGPGEDWSFILDAARFGELAVVNEVLYSYRLHNASNAWQGVEKTLAGLEYARERYIRYQSDHSEYDLDDFQRYWDERSLLEKLGTRLKAVSEIIYREATLNKIEGRRASYYTRVLAAALLNPNKAVSAMTKRLSRNK